MKKDKKSKVGIAEIIGLLLSIIALLIGWMGYGGYLFGIPAIVLGFFYYREKGGLVSLLTIIFGCVGLAETVVVMHLFLPALEETLEEELGIEEKTISLPHVFELSEGEKLKLVSLDVQKVDYVSENFISQEYRVFFPREGFDFYIVRYTVENVGGKKIRFVDLPAAFELITTNETYETLTFYEMDEERGWKSFTTNETEYANNLCEKFFDDLYPNEKASSCVFFEVRKNEKPSKLKFQIWLSSYYIEIQ